MLGCWGSVQMRRRGVCADLQNCFTEWWGRSPLRTGPRVPRRFLLWTVAGTRCPGRPPNSKQQRGTSPVIQWLSLRAPNAGGLGSIPGQGTRSHMHAATKTRRSQINKYINNKRTTTTRNEEKRSKGRNRTMRVPRAEAGFSTVVERLGKWQGGELTLWMTQIKPGRELISSTSPDPVPAK